MTGLSGRYVSVRSPIIQMCGMYFTFSSFIAELNFIEEVLHFTLRSITIMVSIEVVSPTKQHLALQKLHGYFNQYEWLSQLHICSANTE